MADAKQKMTIRCETGRKDDGINLKDQMGGSIGGGRDNLDHSLKGASANQRGK